MSGSDRTLLVSFESAELFRQEYEGNLSNGGLFIATDEPFVLREHVEVELDLRFAQKSVRLAAEVVHTVPVEMKGMGGVPGVAVQFDDTALAMRERLGPIVAAHAAPKPQPAREAKGRDGRGSQRVRARIPARVEGADEVLSGRTRNLSQSGVLVAVRGEAVPVGASVRLTLHHPISGEERAIDGEVVRQVRSGDDVAAIAIRFAPPEDERDAIQEFVEDIQRAEHTRRLGGISGPIDDFGPQALLQMFATTAPRGTLVLRCGEEEGSIGFDSGLMHYARIDNLTGMKALVRLLAWRAGSFEFHSHVEDRSTPEPPFPLEAAIFDAVRQIDEGARVDATRFPLQARLAVSETADLGAYGTLTKVEEAVLDLAHAGFTVQRILDVIPEPDPEIFGALAALGDQGIITLD